MIYRQIGKTDISASVIAFGTFPLGGWMWGGCEEKDALNTISAALDAGINLIDNAPLYGWGKAEEILGKAMKGRRDKFVVSTKCGLRWYGDQWTPESGEFHFRYDEKGLNPNGDSVCTRWLAPASIRWEVEESLRRLGTDYIDIYFTHAPDGTTPVEESIETLIQLKKEGKIRAIGCSNVTPKLLDAYVQSGELDLLQEKFNLIDRTVEKNGLLQTAKENSVSFFAYTPLENGLLTGKMDPARQYGEGDLRKGSRRFAPENIAKINAMLKEFSPIAEAHNISISQLAIAWIYSRYEKGHILCGMRRMETLMENVKAGDVLLTQEECQSMADKATSYQFAMDGPLD